MSSTRFDWIMTGLTAIWLGGVFLDGWAHTHGRVDDTFFTPWHAVLYAAYLLNAAFLCGAAAHGVRRGRPWRRALPTGYGLSLVGAALWVVGGPFDAAWHELFGFEADVLPVGGVAILITVNSVAMGVLYDRGAYPRAAVAALVIAAIAVEGARRALRPDASRPAAFRAFALVASALPCSAYFVTIGITAGIAWSLHLWLGAVVFVGVVGWLLSYLLLPPRLAPGEATT